MNGKQARALRKEMGIKKPTPLDGGGLFKKPDDDRWYFKRASNPIMNMYRRVKRYYNRGY